MAAACTGKRERCRRERGRLDEKDGAKWRKGEREREGTGRRRSGMREGKRQKRVESRDEMKEKRRNQLTVQTLGKRQQQSLKHTKKGARDELELQGDTVTESETR